MFAFSLAKEDLRVAVRHSGEGGRLGAALRRPDRTWSGSPNGTLVHEVATLAPGRALGVGAGEGDDALRLTEQGWKVTATDISGNALARVRAEAERRRLAVDLVRSDANDPAPFDTAAFDLVSLQYGSVKRTPDQRGLRNLLGAVALGCTLLVVHHDLTRCATRWTSQSRPGCTTCRRDHRRARRRPRHLAGRDPRDPAAPPGAAGIHHLDDVVLRSTRRAV